MSVVAREVLRERVEQYAAANSEASLATVLGRFRLDPDTESDNDERALVVDVLAAAKADEGRPDAPRETADDPGGARA